MPIFRYQAVAEAFPPVAMPPLVEDVGPRAPRAVARPKTVDAELLFQPPAAAPAAAPNGWQVVDRSRLPLLGRRIFDDQSLAPPQISPSGYELSDRLADRLIARGRPPRPRDDEWPAISPAQLPAGWLISDRIEPMFLPRLRSNDCTVIAVTTTGGSSPPNSPTLAVTDNGNGTGAVATVTGSTAGSTNTIDVFTIGPTGARVWVNAGSRVGDGTVSLSIANGPYVAICSSVLNTLPAAPSNPCEFVVTGGGSFNCPHAAVAHRVQAAIVNLLGGRITGIVADSVRVRKVPGAADYSSASPLAAGLHAYPAILVVYGDKERDLQGVNARDDIGYPVTIVFAAKDVDGAGRSDMESNDDLYLGWRQTISDVFRNQPFTITNYQPQNPITFQTCNLEYGPIVDWSRWQKDQIFVGAFTLVFVLRKGRG